MPQIYSDSRHGKENQRWGKKSTHWDKNKNARWKIKKYTKMHVIWSVVMISSSLMFSVVEKYSDWKVKSSVWGRGKCRNVWKSICSQDTNSLVYVLYTLFSTGSGKLFLKFWPSSWLLASLSPLEIFDITSTYYVNQMASACLPTIILWLHLTFTANWRAFWPTLLCQLAVVFCQSSPWVNFRVNSQSSLTHHVPQNEWDTRMTALTLPYAS